MRLPLVLCLIATSVLAAPQRVVAVMYFDNNTHKEEFNPLRKGLADMLITDLLGTPGLAIVEREKLQKLVEELDLQKTAFFDPSTALKMGKGVGATHAITGSIAAIDPEIRIDIRLLEIATGKVVVSQQVKGNKDRFFELETELVQKFLAGLKDVDEPAGTRGSSGAQSVAAMVAYGQAIDSADKGDFKTASTQLSKVVASAPTFSLAKDRYQQILKKLYGATQNRDAIVADASAQLTKHADAFLAGKDIAKLQGDDAAHYLAYRLLKGTLLQRQLDALLKTEDPEERSYKTPPMSLGMRPKALPLMRAWYENTALLLAEVGRRPVATLLPAADRELLRSLYGSSPDADEAFFCFNCPDGLALDLARWTILGDPYGKGVRSDPPLGILEPAYATRALQLLDAHRVHLEATKVAGSIAEALFVKGECLLALRRQEEAIAHWQLILDRFPTEPTFAKAEERIKQVLGVTKDQLALDAAIPECLGATRAFTNASREIEKIAGLAGLRPKLLAIEAACQSKAQSGRGVIGQVYLLAANRAGIRRECELFKEWQGKVLSYFPAVREQLKPGACK